jgi:hypothetical protein
MRKRCLVQTAKRTPNSRFLLSPSIVNASYTRILVCSQNQKRSGIYIAGFVKEIGYGMFPSHPNGGSSIKVPPQKGGSARYPKLNIRTRYQRKGLFCR